MFLGLKLLWISPSATPLPHWLLKDQGNVPAHAEDAALGACGQRTLLARSIFAFLPLEGIVLLCMERGTWRQGVLKNGMQG